MALLCPKCRLNGIRIANSIELRPPGVWQECQLQVLDCPSCSYRGPAVYLESRAGALDREIVNHYAYDMTPDDLVELEAEIAKCPDRRSSRCDCESHEAIGGKYRVGEPGVFMGLGAGMWVDWVRDR